MNSIVTYFEQAQLALAAYSNFTPGMLLDAYKLALQDGDKSMSIAQAAAFAAKWNVVTQYTDATTGVSATVFQAVSGGPKYLAIRGTGGLDDIGVDIDLAVGLPMELNLQYSALKTQVQTWLDNGTLASGFTVSGHSLGGYLAVGLEADFGANIGQAYLYNAPGLNGVLGSVTGAILDAFGITAPLDSTKIFNIKANAGVSPIAGLGAQVAPAISIHIEDQFFSDVPNPPLSYNHSQRVLTDALALYAAYAQLDPTASVASITHIIKLHRQPGRPPCRRTTRMHWRASSQPTGSKPLGISRTLATFPLEGTASAYSFLAWARYVRTRITTYGRRIRGRTGYRPRMSRHAGALPSDRRRPRSTGAPVQSLG